MQAGSAQILYSKDDALSALGGGIVQRDLSGEREAGGIPALPPQR